MDREVVMDKEVQMYKEWDLIVSKYLSTLLDMNIYLDNKADENSLEKIRAFDQALREFKAKYPEKFS